MKNSRNYLGPIFVVFLCLLLGACGGSTVGDQNSTNANTRPEQVIGRRGGSIVYRLSLPIKTLNYYMAGDEASVTLTLFLINDKLVTLDHENQAYVPSLAESYTTAADGRTVDVLLRDGLKFSDGTPLTTTDVEFTLKGAYDKRTNAPIFRDGLLVNGKEIETKIIDERRMQFVFPERVSSVENYLENLAVLPKHKLDSSFQAGTLGEAWKDTVDPTSVVSSGPFMIESVQPGEKVTLKRNPHYWKKDAAGKQLPYLDSLVLETVQDPNNTLTRVQDASVDLVDRIRTTDYAALKTTQGPATSHDAGPGLTTDHLWFNLNPAKKNGERLEGTPKHKWFSDKRFRKAVAHAIDRKSIATNTLQGLATPLYGFVPAGNRAWLDPNVAKTEYDLAKARTLLTEAGFTQKDNAGKAELFDSAGDRVEFTMIVQMENEPRKMMAAVVQEDLTKLGMNVQIAPIDSHGVTERWTETFDYDAILFGTSLTAFDPSSFAPFLLTRSTVHQWHPKQKEPATEWEAKIDELFAQQEQETDPGTRKQRFNEIQAIMAEEMPIIPIVSRHIVSAANDRVGNLSPSSVLPFSLWNADRLFVKQ